jgi:hypothetical protein
MKFVQFGCWNQKYCDMANSSTNPLSTVMKALNAYTETEKPDMLIISGDNYYTEKIKIKNAKGKTEKKKIIHLKDLIAGIQCLPKQKGLEINMILGNHDLETQKEKSNNIFIEEIGDAYLEQKNCLILETEQKVVERLKKETQQNFNYDFFLSRYDKATDTLFLLLDTSMYDEDDAEDMLPCYQFFLSQKYSVLNEIKTISAIRTLQRQLVLAAVAEYSDKCKRIIISGHHPIMSYKLKVNEEKPEKTRYEFIEGFPLFIELLKEIHAQASKAAAGQKQQQEKIEYYYLCADLHLYQKGTVSIINNSNKMDIQQYVVGTGGTELDLNPFDPAYAAYILEGQQLNPFEKGITKSINGGEIIYRMTAADVEESNANYGHGFLEVLIENNNIEFTFLKVARAAALGGRIRKKIKTKKTKKQKKTKNQQRKSKHTRKNRYRF